MDELILSKTINTFGLFLDIVGVLMLVKYGLPPDFDPSGVTNLITHEIDELEVEKGKVYKRRSRYAIGLMVLGFALQGISNWVGN